MVRAAICLLAAALLPAQEVVKTQSGASGQKTGAAGTRVGGGGAASRPASRAPGFKGTVVGTRRPGVSVQRSPSGQAAPVGIPADEAPVRTADFQESPAASRAPAAPALAADLAGDERERPDGGAPTASRVLGGAGKEIERELSEPGGGPGLEIILKRAYDAASGAGGSDGVAGRAMELQSQVLALVRVANTSSGKDAPALYQSAIEMIEKSLPGPLASRAAAAVRGYAWRKAAAPTGLKEVAEDGYGSAAAGSRDGVESARQGFSRWDALLGSPGRPLIEHRALLESSILRRLEPGSSREVPSVGFRRSGRTFVPILPDDAVAPAAPRLVAAEAPASSRVDAAAEESRAESLSSGGRRVYAEYRESAGARAVEAGARTASYGARYLWAGAADWLSRVWTWLFGMTNPFLGGGFTVAEGAPLPARWRRAAALSHEIAQDHAALDSILWAGPATVDSARAAFARLEAMASRLKELSGQGRGLASARSLRRSFEEAALGRPGASVLTPGLEPYLGSVNSASLRHWNERFIQEAGLAMAGLKGRGPAALGAAAPAASDFIAGKPGAWIAAGSQVWGRRAGAGAWKAFADLRSTESGGRAALRWRPSALDEARASALSRLGFSAGRGWARLSRDQAASGASDLSARLAAGLAVLEASSPAEAAAAAEDWAASRNRAEGLVLDGASRRVARLLEDLARRGAAASIASDRGPSSLEYVTVAKMESRSLTAQAALDGAGRVRTRILDRAGAVVIERVDPVGQ